MPGGSSLPLPSCTCKACCCSTQSPPSTSTNTFVTASQDVPWLRQDPDQQVPRRPSIAKYPYTWIRQVPLRPVYHLPSPEDPCTTTDAVYDYFPRQQLNNYFHYARIPWMRQVPLRTCTTTVAKIASTSTVAVNNYFPRRLEPLQKRTLQRYNRRERPPWTECMC